MGRRVGAGVEGVLVAAIITFALVASSPVSEQAADIAGAGPADASGQRSIELDGYRWWQDPYAIANFSLTRLRQDSDDLWVRADCFADDGSNAIAGAQPYGRVKWGSAGSLSGHAALDSVKSGSHCMAWLARSWKSTGPAPNWPSTTFTVP
jgi:hypothetical protein